MRYGLMASIFVVFGGRSSPLAGRLADEAKSCVVKSELMRQGCSSSTITRGELSFDLGLLQVCLSDQRGAGPWFAVGGRSCSSRCV